MYLPQAISRPPSIGAQSDFLVGVDRSKESEIKPSLVAFSEPRGDSPCCGDSAFEPGTQGRRRTFPG